MRDSSPWVELVSHQGRSFVFALGSRRFRTWVIYAAPQALKFGVVRDSLR
jgi:hypothetical protein